MPAHSRAVTTFAMAAALGLGLDQATKAIVTATVEGRPAIDVIGRVLTIDVSRNSGAAFSFAPAGTVLFTCLAVGIAALIARQARRLSSVAWAIALGLLLAGAVGNLGDRLFRAPGIGRGAVVDFIDLQHFATFNVADSCLTVGVALALLLSVRGVPMTASARPADAPPTAETPASSAAEPSVTAPSVTPPSVTPPPVTEPPVTEPPVTAPPATAPPATAPPATAPPAALDRPADPGDAAAGPPMDQVDQAAAARPARTASQPSDTARQRNGAPK